VLGDEVFMVTWPRGCRQRVVDVASSRRGIVERQMPDVSGISCAEVAVKSLS
jgi:hypothetical protein